MSGEHGHPDLAALTHSHPHGHPDLESEIALLRGDIARLNAEIEALRDPSGVMEYAYLGKPDAEQIIGRRYTRLDQSLFQPTLSGWEHTLYYLNIRPTFYDGKVAGAIRPRLIRANGDRTAYDDIELHVEALDDEGVALKTRLYWEAGDMGATHIELKCIGGLKSAVLSTRYTKKAVVSLPKR